MMCSNCCNNRHFDPDGSGSVHYGEFVWAFFNRRGLVRQWQRKTKGLTFAQIKERFHRSDINGDGNLDVKEFQRVLKAFGMTLPKEQLEILIDRFDLDGDGEINMQEFLSFIESEQNNFGGSPIIGTAGAAAMASSLLPAPRSVSPVPRLRAASPSPTAAPISETRAPQTARSRSPAAVPSSSASKTRPTSAPPRPPAARPLHATAPSHLQRHHRSVQDADHEEDIDDSSVHARARQSLAATSPATRQSLDGEAETKRREAQPPLPSQPTPSHSDIIGSGQGHKVKDDVDVMWMARMLQAQAEIESRLGKRYYRNA